MVDQTLQARYGLKYNPFLPAIPAEDLWQPPVSEVFFHRVESLVLDGGFALLSGEHGLGKSKLLQLLEQRLTRLGDDVVVGVMERPQSSLGDFYRELGALFGVDLSPANRYGGFKHLRSRWRTHIKSTLFRPVLLIDEAQEVHADCLNELRLLGSAHFDSECLLTSVLAGDSRLPERFRLRDLMALGSRIRSRLVLQPFGADDVAAFLHHLLDRAGAPHLMTEALQQALIDHCAGNPRILTGMAADLLDTAVRKDLPQLDEKLFFEVFSRLPAAPIRRVK